MFKFLSFTYRRMLEDQVRMAAYQKAIYEVVSPGDVVVDLGTGTGILAFFAIQAGAKMVYAIEQTVAAEQARRLAELNGLTDRITFIHEVSDKVELKEKADVIISELLANWGVEEGILQSLPRARKKFLKTGGKLVTEWFDLFVAPVYSPDLWEHLFTFWSKDFYGVDFSPIGQDLLDLRHLTAFTADNLLSEGVRVAHYDLYQVNDQDHDTLSFDANMIVQRNGICHGITGYFEAGLSPDVIISTDPRHPPTHWKHMYLPFKKPVEVQQGDHIWCRIKTHPWGNSPDLFWYWKATVSRQGKEIFVTDGLDVKENVVYAGKALLENNPEE